VKPDLAPIIAYLEIFEAPDFVAATWPDRGVIDGAIQMPYPDYDPAVYEVIGLAVSAFGRRDPYASLPEDPPGVPAPEVVKSLEDIASASVDQVLRFLFLCSRRERFHDGYLDSVFRSGAMVAALRRLQDINHSATE
jgi:Family of unknown function (DUF6508)